MPEVGGLTGTLPGLLPSGPGAAPAASRPPSAAEALGLSPGQLVEAGLVEDLGGGEGVVDIGGKLFRALYPEGLAAGSRLALRVVSTGPPLVLRIPEVGQEALSRLLAPPASGLGQTAQALLSAAVDPRADPLLQGAEVLRLPAAPAELAPALARLLQKFGLFHEALLARGIDPADLKALALRLAARHPDTPLGRLAEALLGHIEAHQARSVLEGVPVLPFALPWGGETVPGEWVVEERQGKGPSGEALSGSLRLRLQMPALGPVEAAVRWGAAGTSVRLRVQPPALEAVSSRLPELRAALADGAAVRLVSLAVEPLGQAPAGRTATLLEVLA